MNGGQPLVSIVVPIWNAERFLREAVESVLAQTYTSWELLLVDDGSRDASADIARSFADRDAERIRFLAHPGGTHHGASISRNLGLREARGEFFAFLDADDVWLPAKLERQVPLLVARPEAGMLYGNTEYWFSWKGAGHDVRPNLGLAPGTLVLPPSLLTLYLQRKAAVPCTCGLLVRREVCDRIGGFEESFPDMYDDQAFYAKMIMAAPVLIAEGCWERYRQHPDSTCAISKVEGTGRKARRFYLTWLMRTLEGHGASDQSDPELWRALRRELRACRHPRLDRVLRWLTERAALADALRGSPRAIRGR